MKRLLLLPILLFVTISLSAQVVSDFENIELEADTFWNGINQEGGFTSGAAFFPNVYSTDFGGFWASGWALSSKTDSLTAGFTNLYSARTGIGANGSAQYALGQQNAVITFPESDGAVILDSIVVTNTTYAYFSMLEGDDFAKKFGGENGDDPDFFKLTIFKYLGDSLYADSVEVYLADFRFENNEEDYILEDWLSVDLRTLGEADSLLFVMASSDVGDFGINTPLFFAIDNLTVAPILVSVNERKPVEANLRLFPNPVADQVYLELESPVEGEGLLEIFSPEGRMVYRQVVKDYRTTVDVSAYPSGWYVLRYQDDKQVASRKLIVK